MLDTSSEFETCRNIVYAAAVAEKGDSLHTSGTTGPVSARPTPADRVHVQCGDGSRAEPEALGHGAISNQYLGCLRVSAVTEAS